jgi:hypothetical protein
MQESCESIFLLLVNLLKKVTEIASLAQKSTLNTLESEVFIKKITSNPVINDQDIAERKSN